METKKINKIPRRLLDLAGRLVRHEDGCDYKDVAANWCTALLNAEQALGMRVLKKLGMPDGLNCPRAFGDWWQKVLPQRPFRKRAKVRLRELGTDESSKWRDGYVSTLAVLDHCSEITALHRRSSELKAEGDRDLAGTVARHCRAEMADMWCILEMLRASDPSFSELCAERAWKFRP